MNAVPESGRLDRGDGHQLAWVRTPGTTPGVMFLGGFQSDMTGTKALALEAHCRAAGRAFLRFDYYGHGASTGRFEDGTIGRWRADALAAFDALTAGPQLLVGSSMGGWLATLLALDRAQRVAGLLTIAAAADFVIDLLPARLSPEQQQRLARDGRIELPSMYSDAPYPICARLIEEGRDHRLLHAPVPYHGPVRLLHGSADADVPWQTSLRLLERLESRDARLVLVKDADHRLSDPAAIALLCATLDELLDAAARHAGD